MDSDRPKSEVREMLKRFFDDGKFKVEVRVPGRDSMVQFYVDSLRFDGDDILILDDEPEQDDDGISYITEGTLNTHPGLLLCDDHLSIMAVDQRDMKKFKVQKIWWEHPNEPLYGYNVMFNGKVLTIGCASHSLAEWMDQKNLVSGYSQRRIDAFEFFKQAVPQFRKMKKDFIKKKFEVEVTLGIKKSRSTKRKLPKVVKKRVPAMR